MNANFNICINTNEMIRYKNGKVLGIIFCQFGTVYFPDKIWTDFTVIILSMWIEALIRLIEKSSTNEIFFFMDGPFLMEIELDNANTCNITLLDTNHNEEFHCTTTIDNLINQIINAADKIINACEKKQWHSDDFADLIKSYSDLINTLNVNKQSILCLRIIQKTFSLSQGGGNSSPKMSSKNVQRRRHGGNRQNSTHGSSTAG
jgi:hypothetical protein